MIYGRLCEQHASVERKTSSSTKGDKRIEQTYRRRRREATAFNTIAITVNGASSDKIGRAIAMRRPLEQAQAAISAHSHASDPPHALNCRATSASE
jgi:hypothetical protein